MKKNIAVIGLGRFGLNLVESFSKLDVDVIAIDNDETACTKAGKYIRNVIVCDSTNEENLREIGIKNIDHAIVAFGQNSQINLSKSIITTVNLKSLGIEEITVRVDDENYIPVIYKVGATDIITPLKFSSERLANKVAAKNFVDYFNISNDYNVVEIKIKEDINSIGIVDLDSPKKYDTTIILIKRNDRLFMPKSTDFIKANDIIFTFGKIDGIIKLNNFLNKKSR